MYVVRSKAGRVVQRFATRAAAERFVRGRTAASPTSDDLGEVARIRVREPLLQERVQTTVPVRIRMSGIDEEWALVVTRGKSPPYGIVDAGRILIVLPGSNDLSEPLAGLVWAKEHGKTYVHQVWVDPEAQRRGVSRMLLDAYRSNVARTLIMKGPFSAGGEALARAAKAKIMRSPTRGFLSGHKRSTERLSIDGWKIRYNEPTYGTREFVVTTRHELAKAKEWLDAGGHSYRVTAFKEGSR